MKELTNLKLNRLNQKFLTEQEMNILLGGGTPGECCCSCSGSSSSNDNDSANNKEGKHSSGCSGGSGDSSGGSTNEYVNPASCWCMTANCYGGGGN